MLKKLQKTKKKKTLKTFNDKYSSHISIIIFTIKINVIRI